MSIYSAKNRDRLIIMNVSDLVYQYADVCNQALLLNRDRFPFKQILGAAQRAEQGSMIEVSIIDIHNAETFVLHLTEKGIVARPHGECVDCTCDRKWGVSKKYLEDVSSNPECYIQNPAYINWEWMYDVAQS